MNYERVDGGVCAPKGFKAAGVTAKIKNLKSTKRDCALVASDRAASAAGAFTTNVLKAPPVQWTEGVCIRGTARAVFVNAGNANACTGSQGVADVQRTAEHLAHALDAPIAEAAVLSTGVIGVPLPMDRILAGVDACVAELRADGAGDAARAIMTTDTVPKEYAVAAPIGGGTVRIGAMCKGSGMIAPNMATMIAIVTTDAAIAAEDLRPILIDAVERTFNCVSVDNDMSTSDACVCLANGASGVRIAAGTPEAAAFAEALHHVCLHMAHALVRDGEGAKKFVEIRVSGAADRSDAKTIARSIANSMLCKTAFAGEDPNWGRIGCAAGYSGVRFDPSRLSIRLDEVEVVHDGLPTDFAEADAKAVMVKPAFVIGVRVGDGPGEATFWTCDLTHEYVSINADYRT